MKYSGWPDTGDLVVGEVDEIEDFGVFVDLKEYADKRGLVHVSEVASGWIKNIRDHVNEGQTVVAKVLDVDTAAQQIDLSLKDVNDHQRSDKIQAWKNEQKADNWMELALGADLDEDTYVTVANALLAEFGSLYDAFEAAAIRGDQALEAVDLADEHRDAIVTAARENVSVPYVTVTGYVDLECPTGTGVDAVKGALDAAEGNGAVPEDVNLAVAYVGAPEYRITVQAPNYKTAERALTESADRAIDTIETAGGTGTFHRDRHEDEA